MGVQTVREAPIDVFSTGQSTIQAFTGSGSLFGLFFGTTPPSTVDIYDATSGTTGRMFPQFAPAANTFYPLMGQVTNGIRVIMNTAADVTVQYFDNKQA
jgi:hypothetical protein